MFYQKMKIKRSVRLFCKSILNATAGYAVFRFVWSSQALQTDTSVFTE